MELTPGQLLRAELKARSISNVSFAAMVKKSTATVQFWLRDKGFGPEQRVHAAIALGERPTYFERPSLVQQREAQRREQFELFLLLPIAHDITDEERKCLESIRLPAWKPYDPTLYLVVFLLIRGALETSELVQALPSVLQGAREFLLHLRAGNPPKIRTDTTAKNQKGRQRPRSAHKGPRK